MFEIVVADYAEVWMHGKAPFVLGQNGGMVAAGSNAPNRVVLTRDARAVFAATQSQAVGAFRFLDAFQSRKTNQPNISRHATAMCGQALNDWPAPASL